MFSPQGSYAVPPISLCYGLCFENSFPVRLQGDLGMFCEHWPTYVYCRVKKQTLKHHHCLALFDTKGLSCKIYLDCSEVYFTMNPDTLTLVIIKWTIFVFSPSCHRSRGLKMYNLGSMAGYRATLWPAFSLTKSKIFTKYSLTVFLFQNKEPLPYSACKLRAVYFRFDTVTLCRMMYPTWQNFAYIVL